MSGDVIPPPSPGPRCLATRVGSSLRTASADPNDARAAAVTTAGGPSTRAHPSRTGTPAARAARSRRPLTAVALSADPVASRIANSCSASRYRLSPWRSCPSSASTRVPSASSEPVPSGASSRQVCVTSPERIASMHMSVRSSRKSSAAARPSRAPRPRSARSDRSPAERSDAAASAASTSTAADATGSNGRCSVSATRRRPTRSPATTSGNAPRLVTPSRGRKAYAAGTAAVPWTSVATPGRRSRPSTASSSPSHSEIACARGPVAAPTVHSLAAERSTRAALDVPARRVAPSITSRRNRSASGAQARSSARWASCCPSGAMANPPASESAWASAAAAASTSSTGGVPSPCTTTAPTHAPFTTTGALTSRRVAAGDRPALRDRLTDHARPAAGSRRAPGTGRRRRRTAAARRAGGRRRTARGARTARRRYAGRRRATGAPGAGAGATRCGGTAMAASGYKCAASTAGRSRAVAPVRGRRGAGRVRGRAPAQAGGAGGGDGLVEGVAPQIGGRGRAARVVGTTGMPSRITITQASCVVLGLRRGSGCGGGGRAGPGCRSWWVRRGTTRSRGGPRRATAVWCSRARRNPCRGRPGRSAGRRWRAGRSCPSPAPDPPGPGRRGR